MENRVLVKSEGQPVQAFMLQRGNINIVPGTVWKKVSIIHCVEQGTFQIKWLNGISEVNEISCKEGQDFAIEMIDNEIRILSGKFHLVQYRDSEPVQESDPGPEPPDPIPTPS